MAERTRVLVVDDDVSFAKSLADVLTEKGYETVAVNSGEYALQKVKGTVFHVILIDIRMPVMNGVETFKQTKKVSPKTVVIMMTGFSVKGLIEEALQNGALGCLRKPLDIDNLVEQIELAREKIC